MPGKIVVIRKYEDWEEEKVISFSAIVWYRFRWACEKISDNGLIEDLLTGNVRVNKLIKYD